jgi:hypothetical protein
MDPNENLRKLRKLVAKDRINTTPGQDVVDVVSMSTLFAGLDAHLSHGGELPREWRNRSPHQAESAPNGDARSPLKEADIECASCGHVVPDSQADVTDDPAWTLIAKDHANDCEWVATRGYRLAGGGGGGGGGGRGG